MFFLYNFEENLSIYGKEIYNILKTSKFLTYNINEANIFITCLSTELNYPKFGNMNYAKPKKPIKIPEFILNIENLNYGKHIFFHHTANTSYHNNLINICYAKKDDDDKNILICPPAITQFNFNSNLNRKFLISFKGKFNRGGNKRLDIINKLLKYNCETIIIIDKNVNNPTYLEIMNNSIFGFVIQGDEPWSYRLTEVINAGIIPVIIKPDNYNILPFSDFIDYSLFSYIITVEQIDNFMQNILPYISENEIIKKLETLKNVNNKYFIDREKQINGIIEHLL